MTTAKGYLEGMSDADCTISPYFDLENLLDLMCVLMNELTVTDGIPDVMAQSSVSISAATATACGVEDASGASITAQVQATGTQTYFSRLITYSITGSDSRTLLIGKDGDNTYLSFAINRPTDSDVYRGVFHQDGSNGITRFEMQGRDKSNGKATVFRIFMDESEEPGEVKVVGSKTDDNTTFVRFAYTGPLDGSDEIGTAMSWANQANGTGVQTCVDPSDSFSSDGTVSNNCGTDSFSSPSINTWNTTMAAAVTTIAGHTDNTFYSGLDESVMIDFDDTNLQSDSIAD